MVAYCCSSQIWLVFPEQEPSIDVEHGYMQDGHNEIFGFSSGTFRAVVDNFIA